MAKEVSIIIRAYNSTKAGIGSAVESIKNLGRAVELGRKAFNLFTSAAFGTGFAIGKWLDDKLKISDRIANMVAPLKAASKAFSAIALEAQKASEARFDKLISDIEAVSKATARAVSQFDKWAGINLENLGLSERKSARQVESRTDISDEQKALQIAVKTVDIAKEKLAIEQKTAEQKRAALEDEAKAIKQAKQETEAKPAQLAAFLDFSKAEGANLEELSRIRGEWSAAVAAASNTEQLDKWQRRLEDISAELATVDIRAEMAAEDFADAQAKVGQLADKMGKAAESKLFDQVKELNKALEEGKGKALSLADVLAIRGTAEMQTDELMDQGKIDALKKKFELTGKIAEAEDDLAKKEKDLANSIKDAALEKQMKLAREEAEKIGDELDRMRNGRGVDKVERRRKKLEGMAAEAGLIAPGNLGNMNEKQLDEFEAKARLARRLGVEGAPSGQQLIEEAQKRGFKPSKETIALLNRADKQAEKDRKERQIKDKEAEGREAFQNALLEAVKAQKQSLDTLLRAAP